MDLAKNIQLKSWTSRCWTVYGWTEGIGNRGRIHIVATREASRHPMYWSSTELISCPFSEMLVALLGQQQSRHIHRRLPRDTRSSPQIAPYATRHYQQKQHGLYSHFFPVCQPPGFVHTVLEAVDWDSGIMALEPKCHQAKFVDAVGVSAHTLLPRAPIWKFNCCQL